MIVEALLLVAGLAALTTAVLVVERALDASAEGAAPGTAALAPLADLARAARRRRLAGPRPAATAPRLLGVALLAVAVARVAALPIDGAVVLGPGIGIVWFVAADLVGWVLLGLLARRIADVPGTARRLVRRASAVEPPTLLALAVPAVAAGALGIADVERAQRSLWFGIEAPVAVLVLVVALAAATAPLPVLREVGAPTREPASVLTGRAALLASGGVVAVPLFAGGGGAAVQLGAAVVLVGILTAVRRVVAVVPPARLVRVCWTVLTPLALVQLAVVSLVVGLVGRP